MEPLKAKFPTISYADLFQLASATAIEATGGPKIPMRYGRVDVSAPEQCPKEGNLPGAAAPFPDGAESPAQHIRNVFYRMGLTDKDIVALSGAHTLGRAHKNRSGMGKETTKFTEDSHIARADGKPGIGSTKGGSAWTPVWLKFDNSYFTVLRDESADPELLKISLRTSPSAPTPRSTRTTRTRSLRTTPSPTPSSRSRAPSSSPPRASAWSKGFARGRAPRRCRPAH